jgi:acetolactate synthase-1/2/3 large subunit
VDAWTINEAARLLIDAQNPVAITSYLGRHHEAVEPLVKLAETLGMRVVSQDMRMNFPTTHPMWAGISPNPYLNDADVVLIIDHLVPYIPANAQPNQSARIIHIDIDPVKTNCPLWQFPVDIRIQADSSKAVPALYEAVSNLSNPDDRARFQQRFQSLQEEHEAERSKYAKEARAKAKRKPISPDWLAYCIAQELRDDDIVVSDTVSNWPTVSRHLRRTKPGTVFHPGGMGLGGVLGTALGAKLAATDSTVVCLTTDGNFIFGEPIATLWAANKYNAPFLTIVFNNRGYHAVGRAINRAYGSESYFQKRGEFEEARFTPSISYAEISRACGVWSAVVDDPAKVPLAIRNGLDRVGRGESVVLEIQLEDPF